MKIAITFVTLLSFFMTMQAQDILVFANGTIQTCGTVVKELPTLLQVEAKGRGTLYIEKKMLAYVQKANGQQLVYNGQPTPVLTIADLQNPNPTSCYQSGKAKVLDPHDAANIDNRTPGSKALVTADRTDFFGNACLTTEVRSYLKKGDMVTVEEAIGGNYLVVFKLKKGILLKGWVKGTDIEIEKSGGEDR